MKSGRKVSEDIKLYLRFFTAGLATPIPEDNKGFQLLAMMGYKYFRVAFYSTDWVGKETV